MTLTDMAWLDGAWALRDAGGLRMESGADGTDADDAPEPPVVEAVGRVWLPLERLIVRPFRLPLSHPRFVDAAVLAGELEDQTGESPGDWHLAWRAAVVAGGDGGVVGLMAAMPRAWREAFDACQPLSAVRVDAVDRLAWRLEETDAVDGVVAVLDADAEGICLGAARDGAWLGVTRVNREDLADEEVRRWVTGALLAMGWTEDMPAVGALDATAAAWFADWRGETLEALPARAQATLRGRPLPAMGIEFRRGDWAARGDREWLRPWRRAAWLAAGLCALWVGGMALEHHRLEREAAVARARILAAFARALPGEPAVEPLAQLRRAAGVSIGEAGNEGSGDAASWLRQAAALARVYEQTPWTLEELDWRDGMMRMSGEAADLAALNRIREALARALGREVRLLDTRLGRGKVGFRLEWPA